jgi:hypothetical protein
LTERLAEEARQEDAPFPPFLHGRILASLDQPETRAVPGLLRPVWAATAMVFCVLSVGALFFMRHERSALDPAADSTSAQNSRLAAGLLAAAAQLPARNTLFEWGLNLDKPLETEMKSVVEDARIALVGVVHHFVPDDSNLLR